jgi:proline dehydrogenase
MNSYLERLFAGRWIAGPEISDALAAALKLNSLRIRAKINYLGEDLSDKVMVNDAVKTYLEVIDEARKRKVEIFIAVKPTQIGSLQGRKALLSNYLRITKAARSAGIMTWLDMESHREVDETLWLYGKEMKRGMVGICIQSYLKRSFEDMKRIVEDGGVVRLVKGAYRENESIAYASRKEISDNYTEMMRYLFKSSEKFMIATHDTDMIRKALALERKYRKKAMFGMLNGVRNKYALELAEKGEDVTIYLPFGKEWIQYAYRRLRESSNLKLILRSLMEKQDIY